MIGGWCNMLGVFGGLTAIVWNGLTARLVLKAASNSDKSLLSEGHYTQGKPCAWVDIHTRETVRTMVRTVVRTQVWDRVTGSVTISYLFSTCIYLIFKHICDYPSFCLCAVPSSTALISAGDVREITMLIWNFKWDICEILPGERLRANLVWKSHSSLSR